MIGLENVASFTVKNLLYLVKNVFKILYSCRSIHSQGILNLTLWVLNFRMKYSEVMIMKSFSINLS